MGGEAGRGKGVGTKFHLSAAGMSQLSVTCYKNDFHTYHTRVHTQTYTYL